MNVSTTPYQSFYTRQGVFFVHHAHLYLLFGEKANNLWKKNKTLFLLARVTRTIVVVVVSFSFIISSIISFIISFIIVRKFFASKAKFLRIPCENSAHTMRNFFVWKKTGFAQNLRKYDKKDENLSCFLILQSWYQNAEAKFQCWKRKAPAFFADAN